MLGGETSGHIIWLGGNSTGDGIIATLQIIVAMQRTGQSLHELKADISKVPQVLISLPVKAPTWIAQHEVVQKSITRISALLETRGRVLVRPSGTEPKIRIMIEGENLDEITQLANELAEVIKSTDDIYVKASA